MAGVTCVTGRDKHDLSRLRERDERDAPLIGASRRHGGVTGAPDYGPWATDIDPAERIARLRAFRALVRTFAGPAGRELSEALKRAEASPEALEQAGRLLGTLKPIPFRHVLSSYAALETA